MIDQTILGTIIAKSHEVFGLTLEYGVTRKWFIEPKDADLFDIMVDLHARGIGIDALTIGDRFNDDAYIDSLIDSAVLTAHFEGHLQLFRASFYRKEALSKITQYREQIEEASLGEAEKLVSRFQDDLCAIGVQSIERKTMYGAAKQWLDMALSTSETDGVPWPFTDMQRELGKIYEGVIFISAAEKTGKTAWAVQLANFWDKMGIVNSIASLESSAESLASRLLAQRSEVNMLDVRNGRSFSSDKVDLALEGLMNSVIRITDTPMTMSQIRAWAMNEKRHGSRILQIDNTRNIRSDRTYKTRTEMMDDFSISLKNISSDLSMPIIVYHHNNFENDVADAKSLKRDVHMLMMMEPNFQEAVNSIDFKVKLNRDGPAGMSFTKQFERDIVTFK